MAEAILFMRKSKYEQYLEEYKTSGMSIKGFCEEKQINYNGFDYMYLSRERQNAEVVTIRPDEKQPGKEETKGIRFRLSIGKMVLEAQASSKSELEMVLEAMKDVQESMLNFNHPARNEKIT